MKKLFSIFCIINIFSIHLLALDREEFFTNLKDSFFMTYELIKEKGTEGVDNAKKRYQTHKDNGDRNPFESTASELADEAAEKGKVIGIKIKEKVIQEHEAYLERKKARESKQYDSDDEATRK